MTEAFLDLPNGRCHYLRYGDGSPLLLLHSNGTSLHEFRYVRESLAKKFSVFTIDLPGHGDSEEFGVRFEIHAVARWVTDFITSLKLEGCTVAGNSLGGVVALEAARLSRSVDKAILIETPLRTNRQWEAIWPQVEAAFAGTTQTLEDICQRFVSVDEGFLLQWNIDRNKAGVRTMMRAMWAIREFDATPALVELEDSVLFVIGDKGAVSDGAKVLTAISPSARMVTLENCGHFPAIDTPEQLVHNVLDFLSLGKNL